jgi:uncharacterized repeat protein (TIGR01451 family)
MDHPQSTKTIAELKSRLPALLVAILCLALTGCEQMQPTARKNRPQMVVAPKAGVPAVPPVKAAPKLNTAETTIGSIRFTKTLPAEVVAGGEFLAELTLTAPGSPTNIVLRDVIPAGAIFLRSEPAATLENGELTWKFSQLAASQPTKVKVWFQAEQAGTPSGIATLAVGPRPAATVCVGRPMLAMDLTGPEIATLGSEVIYNISIRNISSAPVRNVAVNETVPAGLNHSSGKSALSFELGELTPGQSKALTIALKANQRGKACSTATVISTNAPKVSREVCTLVLVPGLKVEKTGTKEQIIGRNADYEILVSNTGDTTLTNLLLSDVTPDDCSIVAAPGAVISGNKATWVVPELKPGARHTETIKLTAKAAGASCNTVTARIGSLSDTAKACTLWNGVPAVSFELTESTDPIQIGESTTYTIKISNPGSGDIHNMKATATFEALIAPINSPQGTVNGQRVTFPTVATIGAKQSVTYTVIAKGSSAGDARTKVELSCDELKTPLLREESTTIY